MSKQDPEKQKAAEAKQKEAEAKKLEAQKAAEKAKAEAEKAAKKAKEEAEKAAAKAAKEAEKAAEKAKKEAEKAEAKAKREAERAEAKAKREAEKEARKGQPRPPKPWQDLPHGHEQQAPREGSVLHKTLEFMAKNKGATLQEIQDLIGEKHNARRLLTWAHRERGYGFVMIKERITPLAPNLRVEKPKTETA